MVSLIDVLPKIYRTFLYLVIFQALSDLVKLKFISDSLGSAPFDIRCLSAFGPPLQQKKIRAGEDQTLSRGTRGCAVAQWLSLCGPMGLEKRGRRTA